MTRLAFSSLLSILLAFLAAQAHSSPANLGNITADPDSLGIPSYIWAIPRTTTIIALYKEEHGGLLKPADVRLAMLLARFALQRQAQDAGGQHLPLTQDFQYEAQGYTVAARQAGPTVVHQSNLLYSDVENMFTAIEQQLFRVDYVETNIQILRNIGMKQKVYLGFGMIGKSKSGSVVGDQSNSLNQTVTAIEKQLSIPVAPPVLVNDTLTDLNNGVNAGGDGSTTDSKPVVTS